VVLAVMGGQNAEMFFCSRLFSSQLFVRTFANSTDK
jgi:hypothetical protein